MLDEIFLAVASHFSPREFCLHVAPFEKVDKLDTTRNLECKNRTNVKIDNPVSKKEDKHYGLIFKVPIHYDIIDDDLKGIKLIQDYDIDCGIINARSISLLPLASLKGLIFRFNHKI